MVRDVAHLLLGQSLMIPQLLARDEVAAAPIADKEGGVFALVLLDDVLPGTCKCVIELGSDAGNLPEFSKLGEVGHGAAVMISDVEAVRVPLPIRAAQS